MGSTLFGQKSPNELGLYDMNENIWKWCNDWFGEFEIIKRYGRNNFKFKRMVDYIKIVSKYLISHEDRHAMGYRILAPI